MRRARIWTALRISSSRPRDGIDLTVDRRLREVVAVLLQAIKRRLGVLGSTLRPQRIVLIASRSAATSPTACFTFLSSKAPGERVLGNECVALLLGDLRGALQRLAQSVDGEAEGGLATAPAARRGRGQTVAQRGRVGAGLFATRSPSSPREQFRGDVRRLDESVAFARRALTAALSVFDVASVKLFAAISYPLE